LEISNESNLHRTRSFKYRLRKSSQKQLVILKRVGQKKCKSHAHLIVVYGIFPGIPHYLLITTEIWTKLSAIHEQKSAINKLSRQNSMNIEWQSAIL